MDQQILNELQIINANLVELIALLKSSVGSVRTQHVVQKTDIASSVQQQLAAARAKALSLSGKISEDNVGE